MIEKLPEDFWWALITTPNTELYKPFKVLCNKINEIIDRLNKLEEEVYNAHSHKEMD